MLESPKEAMTLQALVDQNKNLKEENHRFKTRLEEYQRIMGEFEPHEDTILGSVPLSILYGPFVSQLLRKFDLDIYDLADETGMSTYDIGEIFIHDSHEFKDVFNNALFFKARRLYSVEEETEYLDSLVEHIFDDIMSQIDENENLRGKLEAYVTGIYARESGNGGV